MRKSVYILLIVFLFVFGAAQAQDEFPSAIVINWGAQVYPVKPETEEGWKQPMTHILGVTMAYDSFVSDRGQFYKVKTSLGEGWVRQNTRLGIPYECVYLGEVTSDGSVYEYYRLVVDGERHPEAPIFPYKNVNGNLVPAGSWEELTDWTYRWDQSLSVQGNFSYQTDTACYWEGPTQ